MSLRFTAERDGGEQRGNNTDRKNRKAWMLDHFGDGKKAPCHYCKKSLTKDTITADRIQEGGSYAHDNIRPACKSCNNERSNPSKEGAVTVPFADEVGWEVELGVNPSGGPIPIWRGMMLRTECEGDIADHPILGPLRDYFWKGGDDRWAADLLLRMAKAKGGVGAFWSVDPYEAWTFAGDFFFASKAYSRTDEGWTVTIPIIFKGVIDPRDDVYDLTLVDRGMIKSEREVPIRPGAPINLRSVGVPKIRPNQWLRSQPGQSYRHYPEDFTFVSMRQQVTASTKPTAVIWDLDGTLSSTKWRAHHLQGPDKDWESFFDGIPSDAPVPAMVSRLKADAAEGHSIQIVTGRPATYRRQTEFWLAEHGIGYDTLHMRPKHDQTADYAVKQRILDHIRQTHDVVRAYDDRDGNLAMFEQQGVETVRAVDPALPPRMATGTPLFDTTQRTASKTPSGQTLYRGMSLSFSGAESERIAALLRSNDTEALSVVVRQSLQGRFGRHWSRSKRVAEDFSGSLSVRGDRVVLPVVLWASPDTEGRPPEDGRLVHEQEVVLDNDPEVVGVSVPYLFSTAWDGDTVDDISDFDSRFTWQLHLSRTGSKTAVWTADDFSDVTEWMPSSVVKQVPPQDLLPYAFEWVANGRVWQTPDGYMEALMESIKRDGFKQAITVQLWTDGAISIHGNHRLAVALRLGLPTVPVVYEDQHVPWTHAQGAFPPPFSKTASRHVTCEHGTFWGPHGAAGALLRTASKPHRYLLQKRAQWVDHGGTWGLPGGAIDAGESIEQAARREAMEEGVDLSAARAVGQHVNEVCEHWAYTTVIFEVPGEDEDGDGVPDAFQTSEADGHGWFTAEEARALPLHPALKGTWGELVRTGSKTAGLDLDAIDAIRDRVSDGGSQMGVCGHVTAEIERTFGYAVVRGRYGSTLHAWNLLPDGRLLDATADQFGHEVPRITRPGEDPKYRPFTTREIEFFDLHQQVNWGREPDTFDMASFSTAPDEEQEETLEWLREETAQGWGVHAKTAGLLAPVTALQVQWRMDPHEIWDVKWQATRGLFPKPGAERHTEPVPWRGSPMAALNALTRRLDPNVNWTISVLGAVTTMFNEDDPVGLWDGGHMLKHPDTRSGEMRALQSRIRSGWLDFDSFVDDIGWAIDRKTDHHDTRDLEIGTEVVIYRGVQVPVDDDPASAARWSGGVGMSWTTDLEMAKAIAEQGPTEGQSAFGKRPTGWGEQSVKELKKPVVYRATVKPGMDGSTLWREHIGWHSGENEVHLPDGTPVVVTGIMEAEVQPMGEVWDAADEVFAGEVPSFFSMTPEQKELSQAKGSVQYRWQGFRNVSIQRAAQVLSPVTAMPTVHYPPTGETIDFDLDDLKFDPNWGRSVDRHQYNYEARVHLPDGRGPIAYMTVSWFDHPTYTDKPEAMVESIEVREEFRRKGIGAWLYQKMIDHIRSQNPGWDPKDLKHSPMTSDGSALWQHVEPRLGYSRKHGPFRTGLVYRGIRHIRPAGEPSVEGFMAAIRAGQRGEGIGTHWTTDKDVALMFARELDPQQGQGYSVVLTAHGPVDDTALGVHPADALPHESEVTMSWGEPLKVRVVQWWNGHRWESDRVPSHMQEVVASQPSLTSPVTADWSPSWRTTAGDVWRKVQVTMDLTEVIDLMDSPMVLSAAIMDELTKERVVDRYHGRTYKGLGKHWSEDEHTARTFDITQAFLSGRVVRPWDAEWQEYGDIDRRATASTTTISFSVLIHGYVEQEAIRTDKEVWKEYNMVTYDQRYDFPVTEQEVPVKVGGEVLVKAIEAYLPTRQELQEGLDHFVTKGEFGRNYQKFDWGNLWKRFEFDQTFTASRASGAASAVRGMRLRWGGIYGNGDRVDAVKQALRSRDHAALARECWTEIERGGDGVGRWWQAEDAGNTWGPHGIMANYAGPTRMDVDSWEKSVSVGVVIHADLSEEWMRTEPPPGTPIEVTGLSILDGGGHPITIDFRRQRKVASAGPSLRPGTSLLKPVTAVVPPTPSGTPDSGPAPDVTASTRIYRGVVFEDGSGSPEEQAERALAAIDGGRHDHSHWTWDFDFAEYFSTTLADGNYGSVPWGDLSHVVFVATCNPSDIVTDEALIKRLQNLDVPEPELVLKPGSRVNVQEVRVHEGGAWRTVPIRRTITASTSPLLAPVTSFARSLDWQHGPNRGKQVSWEAIHHGVRFRLRGTDAEMVDGQWGRSKSGGWTLDMLEPDDEIGIAHNHHHRFPQGFHDYMRGVKTHFDTLAEGKQEVQDIIASGLIDEMIPRDLFPPGEFRYHLTMARNVGNIMSQGLKPGVQRGTGSSVFGDLSKATHILWDLKDEDWASHEGEPIALLKLDVGGMARATIKALSSEERANEVIPPERIEVVNRSIPWVLTNSSFHKYNATDAQIMRFLSGDVDTLREFWTGSDERFEEEVLPGLRVMASRTADWEDHYDDTVQFCETCQVWLTDEDPVEVWAEHTGNGHYLLEHELRSDIVRTFAYGSTYGPPPSALKDFDSCLEWLSRRGGLGEFWSSTIDSSWYERWEGTAAPGDVEIAVWANRPSWHHQIAPDGSSRDWEREVRLAPGTPIEVYAIEVSHEGKPWRTLPGSRVRRATASQAVGSLLSPVTASPYRSEEFNYHGPVNWGDRRGWEVFSADGPEGGQLLPVTSSYVGWGEDPQNALWDVRDYVRKHSVSTENGRVKIEDGKMVRDALGEHLVLCIPSMQHTSYMAAVAWVNPLGLLRPLTGRERFTRRGMTIENHPERYRVIQSGMLDFDTFAGWNGIVTDAHHPTMPSGKKVTVYRGMATDREHGINDDKGIGGSWTTDLDVAKQFALKRQTPSHFRDTDYTLTTPDLWEPIVLRAEVEIGPEQQTGPYVYNRNDAFMLESEIRIAEGQRIEVNGIMRGEYADSSWGMGGHVRWPNHFESYRKTVTASASLPGQSLGDLPESEFRSKRLVYHATSYEDDARTLLTQGVRMDNVPMNLARRRYQSGEYAQFAPGAGVGMGLYVSDSGYGASGYGKWLLAIEVRDDEMDVPPESNRNTVREALQDNNGAIITKDIPASRVWFVGRTLRWSVPHDDIWPVAKQWVETGAPWVIPGKESSLLAPVTASQTVRVYHGTTAAALESIRRDGEFRRSEPEAVAHGIEQRYGLPHDSVWRHEFNSFSWGRASDSTLWTSTRREEAEEYARLGSEVVWDALFSAWHLLNDAFDDGNYKPGMTEARDRWIAEETAKHYRPVVITLEVPLFLTSEQTSGTINLPTPLSASHIVDEQRLASSRTASAKPPGADARTVLTTAPRASREDLLAGLVPGVWVDRSISPGLAGHRRNHAQGLVTVAPDFADNTPFERYVFLAHELGHDVSRVLNSVVPGTPVHDALSRYRKDDSRPLSFDNLRNPFGMNNSPSEIVADAYADLLLGELDHADPGGPKHQLLTLVAETARGLGMPDREIAGRPRASERLGRAKTASSRQVTADRAGGDKRGNSYARAVRKQWLLNHYGDGHHAPCWHCGTPVDYLTMDVDRIDAGGSYRRENVIPSCRQCNLSRSDDEMEWDFDWTDHRLMQTASLMGPVTAVDYDYDEAMEGVRWLVDDYRYPWEVDDTVRWAEDMAVRHPILWRGVAIYDMDEGVRWAEDFRNNGWAVDQQRHGSHLASASKSRKIAEEFAEGGGVLFKIRNGWGAAHELLNASGNDEQEVLLVPQRFRYVSHEVLDYYVLIEVEGVGRSRVASGRRLSNLRDGSLSREAHCSRLHVTRIEDADSTGFNLSGGPITLWRSVTLNLTTGPAAQGHSISVSKREMLDLTDMLIDRNVDGLASKVLDLVTRYESYPSDKILRGAPGGLGLHWSERQVMLSEVVNYRERDGVEHLTLPVSFEAVLAEDDPYVDQSEVWKLHILRGEQQPPIKPGAELNLRSVGVPRVDSPDDIIWDDHTVDSGLDDARWKQDCDIVYVPMRQSVYASAKTASGYRIQHQPGTSGPPLHDLLGEDSWFPEDVYDSPQHYVWGDNTRRTLEVVQRARGNPTMEVEVFRAVPKGITRIETGNWVYLDKDLAIRHGFHATDESLDMPVIRARVWAEDVRNGGNDLMEWGYAGPDTFGVVVHEGGENATPHGLGFRASRTASVDEQVYRQQEETVAVKSPLKRDTLDQHRAQQIAERYVPGVQVHLYDTPHPIAPGVVGEAIEQGGVPMIGLWPGGHDVWNLLHEVAHHRAGVSDRGNNHDQPFAEAHLAVLREHGATREADQLDGVVTRMFKTSSANPRRVLPFVKTYLERRLWGHDIPPVEIDYTGQRTDSVSYDPSTDRVYMSADWARGADLRAWRDDGAEVVADQIRQGPSSSAESLSFALHRWRHSFEVSRQMADMATMANPSSDLERAAVQLREEVARSSTREGWRVDYRTPGEGEVVDVSLISVGYDVAALRGYEMGNSTFSGGGARRAYWKMSGPTLDHGDGREGITSGRFRVNRVRPMTRNEYGGDPGDRIVIEMRHIGPVKTAAGPSYAATASRMVIIYRAVPSAVDHIRPGDYVSMDPVYTMAHAEAMADWTGEDWHVLTLEVSADEVEWAGPWDGKRGG